MEIREENKQIIIVCDVNEFNVISSACSHDFNTTNNLTLRQHDPVYYNTIKSVVNKNQELLQRKESYDNSHQNRQ